MSRTLRHTSLASERWTMLVGEPTLVFHLADLEVTSGDAASSATLRGDGSFGSPLCTGYSQYRKLLWVPVKIIRICGGRGVTATLGS